MTGRTRDLGVVLCLLCATMVAGCPGDRMSRGTTEAVDDSLIANKVTLALYSDKQVSGRGITVEAAQGIVELTGVVASTAEAQRASTLTGTLGHGTADSSPPVQVQLRLGETRVRMNGTLAQGAAAPGLAAQVAIQGSDPARLSTLLPLSIPSLPAYRLEGHLLHNGSTWTLKELKGSIGDSDLAGELSLNTDGKRIVLQGELRSQIFVVDELMGYAPEKKPGRVEPEKVQVPAQVQEQVQERPQAIEVNVRFRSNKVIVAKVPLEQFSTDLQLHNDRLALTPTFHLGYGQE